MPKMKLNTSLVLAAIVSSCCAASQEENLSKRAEYRTCSLGIGRQFADIYWDVTIYNVAQPKPQDFNIMAQLKMAKMDKGDSIAVSWPPHTINITNVDNAPVFTYNEPNLKAEFTDFEPGETKVALQFQVGTSKWTTDDCSASSVVFSAGREGWACNFPCP
ncbi:hypothetical protein WAI453_003692 [Rhynchosporium graminicola]